MNDSYENDSTSRAFHELFDYTDHMIGMYQEREATYLRDLRARFCGSLIAAKPSQMSLESWESTVTSRIREASAHECCRGVFKKELDLFKESVSEPEYLAILQNPSLASIVGEWAGHVCYEAVGKAFKVYHDIVSPNLMPSQILSENDFRKAIRMSHDS